MIVIDDQKIFDTIHQRRPSSVALAGPDGILPQVRRTAQEISRRFDIPAYILADPTWGSCDINSAGARTLAADLQFNIGHTISMPELEGAVMIEAYDDIPFDAVAAKCAKVLAGMTVSLLTDSQHLHQMDTVRGILQDHSVTVLVGAGAGQLNDGQVFGCEFYPAAETADTADANVFLGQSSFHAAGVAISTGLPTYLLDPYFNEVREVTEFAQKLQKKATLAVYKAAQAQTFGVIVGLKEGQLSKLTALKFKRRLEELGKTVILYALADITNERLARLEADAFIQTACPRISTDNHFDRPVLSTPQAGALIRILKGESPGSYMQVPHWL